MVTRWFLFSRADRLPSASTFIGSLHEGNPLQAIRFGTWKAVKNGPSAPVELYDLKADAGETKDLASANPQVVAEAVKMMASARTEDPNWPLNVPSRKQGKKARSADQPKRAGVGVSQP